MKDALIDAMLRYSQSLALGADEWLVVAARDRGEPGVGADDPFDVDDDPAARSRAPTCRRSTPGSLTRDEARKRVEVREY